MLQSPRDLRIRGGRDEDLATIVISRNEVEPLVERDARYEPKLETDVDSFPTVEPTLIIDNAAVGRMAVDREETSPLPSIAMPVGCAPGAHVRSTGLLIGAYSLTKPSLPPTPFGFPESTS